jgi:hypothetical protein
MVGIAAATGITMHAMDPNPERKPNMVELCFQETICLNVWSGADLNCFAKVSNSRWYSDPKLYDGSLWLILEEYEKEKRYLNHVLCRMRNGIERDATHIRTK